MSMLPSNGQPKYTHQSNCIMEFFLEMYDIEELPIGKFPIIFKTINHYQQEYPTIKANLLSAKYKKGYFPGGRNYINLVTHKDKIVIIQKPQNM